MLSKKKSFKNWIFEIFYWICSKFLLCTISIISLGFSASTFTSRAEVQLPGQKIFTSKPPLCYTPQHMFIGATLIINGFKFVLVEADEYALRYMEINCGQVRLIFGCYYY